MRNIGLLALWAPSVVHWLVVWLLKEYVDGILKRTVGMAAIWIRFPAHSWKGSWGVHNSHIPSDHNP